MSDYAYPPEFPAHDPRHGTRTGYDAHKCRCEECRKANAVYQRERVTEPKPLPPNDPRHGTTNSYTYYKCSCERCREAWADYHRVYRAKRRILAALGRAVEDSKIHGGPR